jgi:hypothetical protein
MLRGLFCAKPDNPKRTQRKDHFTNEDDGAGIADCLRLNEAVLQVSEAPFYKTAGNCLGMSFVTTSAGGRG